MSSSSAPRAAPCPRAKSVPLYLDPTLATLRAYTSSIDLPPIPPAAPALSSAAICATVMSLSEGGGPARPFFPPGTLPLLDPCRKSSLWSCGPRPPRAAPAAPVRTTRSSSSSPSSGSPPPEAIRPRLSRRARTSSPPAASTDPEGGRGGGGGKGCAGVPPPRSCLRSSSAAARLAEVVAAAASGAAGAGDLAAADLRPSALSPPPPPPPPPPSAFLRLRFPVRMPVSMVGKSFVYDMHMNQKKVPILRAITYIYIYIYIIVKQDGIGRKPAAPRSRK